MTSDRETLNELYARWPFMVAALEANGWQRDGDGWILPSDPTMLTPVPLLSAMIACACAPVVEQDAHAKTKAERDAWKALAKARAGLLLMHGGMGSQDVKVVVQAVRQAEATLRDLGIDPEAP